MFILKWVIMDLMLLNQVNSFSEKFPVYRAKLTVEIILLVPLWYSMAYSEPYQTSKMECFAKIVNTFQALTIFAKGSILDIWQGSEYASDIL